MQSLPSVFDDPDLDDMGQKELGVLIEKLTGRVTSLENKFASITKSTKKEKWSVDRWIALGILVFTIIGLPLIVTSWVEPHLHNDLKNDVKIEVAEQLKEPLKDLRGMATDIAEVKGQLKELSPLLQQMTLKRLHEAENLSPKQLIAQLSDLKSLARTARAEKVAVKPETVEKIGKKLLEAGASGVGGADAWGTALDFLNYRSFLNASLSISANSVQGNGVLTTLYVSHAPPGLASPQFGVAGAVPTEEAAQFVDIGQPNPNASLPLGNDWIIATGGNLTIDNVHMKKVILRNVHVFYNGGPLEMQEVYFINCTFEVRHQSNGEGLIMAALQGVAVNFNAS